VKLSSHPVTWVLPIHPYARAALYCLCGQKVLARLHDGGKESGNLLAFLVEAKFKSRWECILLSLRLTATMDERLMLAV